MACGSWRSSNRSIQQAERAYAEAGVDTVRRVETVAALEAAIDRGEFAITEDATLLCKASQVEAVIETTGDAEVGALVALEAIRHGKHIILMNAETDSAVGPILKVYADRAGVIYTYTDGDEPGVAMNLYRFVDSIGYRPVLMGQIKGFLNRYRNPETQSAFAAKTQSESGDGRIVCRRIEAGDRVDHHRERYRICAWQEGYVRPRMRARKGPAQAVFPG